MSGTFPSLGTLMETNIITIQMNGGTISQVNGECSGDVNGNNDGNNDRWDEVEEKENETKLVRKTVLCDSCEQN